MQNYRRFRRKGENPQTQPLTEAVFVFSIFYMTVLTVIEKKCVELIQRARLSAKL